MFPIEQKALDLFIQNYLQTIEIKFDGVQDSIVITEADIVQGGLVINRGSTAGDKLEVGATVASELSVNLDNTDGKFDNVVFEGATLTVKVGIKKWDAHQWEDAQFYNIPMGKFIVDNPPRKHTVINLQAFDKMVLFDKFVDNAHLPFPMDIESLLYRICDECGVVLAPQVSSLLNAHYSVYEAPSDENATYRQYLSWICEITGTNAYIDHKGELVLDWYKSTPNITITPSDRFDSDLQENSVTITGVQIIANEESYLSGTDDYCIRIEENPLIQHDFTSLADSLSVRFKDFEYTPYTAVIFSMPHLYPLDSVVFVDKSGNEKYSIINDYTFTANANTQIAGKGQTVTDNGYATASAFTDREKTIIKTLQANNEKYENSMIQSTLHFNELISNALGMHMTAIDTGNDSKIYYLHNKEAIEDSNIIFTMTSDGIAWTTDGWNDGNPNWSHGVTSAGNALFRMLSAEGITVSNATDAYSIEITPRAFNVYYRRMLVTSITGDTMTIPKAEVTDYLEIGKIQIAPHVENDVLIGTDIIFIE